MHPPENRNVPTLLFKPQQFARDLQLLNRVLKKSACYYKMRSSHHHLIKILEKFMKVLNFSNKDTFEKK